MASIEIRAGWYDQYEEEGRGHRITIVGDDPQAVTLRSRLVRLDPGDCNRVHGTGWTFEHPNSAVQIEEWASSLVTDALGPDAAPLIDFAASEIEVGVGRDERSGDPASP